MLSFNELQTLFNALVPLSDKALVTGRLLGIADNFRFENITLNDEMLQKLVRNHSVGVSCGVMIIRHTDFISCSMNWK